MKTIVKKSIIRPKLCVGLDSNYDAYHTLGVELSKNSGFLTKQDISLLQTCTEGQILGLVSGFLDSIPKKITYSSIYISINYKNILFYLKKVGFFYRLTQKYIILPIVELKYAIDHTYFKTKAMQGVCVRVRLDLYNNIRGVEIPLTPNERRILRKKCGIQARENHISMSKLKRSLNLWKSTPELSGLWKKYEDTNIIWEIDNA